MFALLGEIQFDLITYFDGFDSQFDADYAEHALIEGKPRLQWTGDKLDEISIQLSFHAQFCDPELELLRLKSAKEAHQAMALVLGNGDYKGWFVLTQVRASSRQTDQAGTLIALEASITLREFVGDKQNPLPPPAVQPGLPPAAATALPANLNARATAIGSSLAGTANAVRYSVRQVVTSTTQARSAMRVALDATQLAQSLRGNPSAALSRLPGLQASLTQVTVPLARLSPAAASLTGALPEAAGILRSSDRALTALRNAQGSLSGTDAGNVASRIDYVAAQLASASGVLQVSTPATARLASQVITRTI